jgi:hypothetical protein
MRPIHRLLASFFLLCVLHVLANFGLFGLSLRIAISQATTSSSPWLNLHFEQDALPLVVASSEFSA